MAGKTNTKRKDSHRVVLKTGESQRKDGTYDFRWTSFDGKRHSVYAKTLTELREKERNIEKEAFEGLSYDRNSMTITDLFKVWFSLKRGIRDSTLQTYSYAYKYGIAPYLGDILLKELVASQVKMAYIQLLEVDGKNVETIRTIHQVLMQALDFAVNDNLLKSNPAKKVYADFKKEADYDTSKKMAMTQEEQELFFKFLASNDLYKKWENLMLILNGTGMRIGEALALQWEDLDFENNVININKTLIYLKTKDKTELQMHLPKTKASLRQIPMSVMVAQAFLNEKKYQESQGITCIDNIGGYSNFVFVGRNGHARNNISVNVAVKRMVAKYNKKSLASGDAIFLPDISCHTFRHNFATRLFECGIEPKVVQTYLGHSRISITMDTYTDFFAETNPGYIFSIDQFLTPKLTPIET